jgi:hypothetical protein
MDVLILRSVFLRSILIMTVGCFLQIGSVSAAVVVDGVNNGDDTYTNQFQAKWTNGHEKESIYDDWSDETTVRWAEDADYMYLYLEVPLYAKTMVWGTGCDDAACLDEYKDHYATHHGDTLVMDYGKATGSEKTEFDVIFGGGSYEGKLQGASNGAGIVEFASSLDWLLDNGCDTTNCGASGVEMSFEFKFDLTEVVRNDIIASLEDPAQGLVFHLSPERRAGVVPVPAAAWLFGSSLGLLGWMRRRAA